MGTTTPDDDAPPDTPRSTPPKRRDRRPTMTLKGDGFGPELRALLSRAARVRGMTQAELAEELLRDGAQRILRGEPVAGGDAGAGLPAPIADKLEATTEAVAALAERLERLERRDGRAVAARIAEARERVARAFGALMGR
jgi:hypothetical protein